MQKRLAQTGTGLLPLLLLLLVWSVASVAIHDRTVLPTPWEAAMAVRDLWVDSELLKHLLATLRRIAVGYGLATTAGLTLGVLAGRSRWVWTLFYPVNESLRPIPALAIFPVMLVLLGVGDRLVQSLILYSAFFPIWTATAAAVRGTQRIYQEAALTMGASGWTVVWEVVLPEALARILAGLRTGLAFAWMSVVGAELIGANSGLGYLISYYQNVFLVPQVVAGMVIIGILGLILDRLLQYLQRRLTPWAVQRPRGV